MMDMDNLKKLSAKELLQLHASIIEELRDRKIVRTKNNPVGDYAEWLVSTMLGFELSTNSNFGYDSVDNDNVRYQIKARRVTPDNKSRQLGIIRNLDDNSFDFLIAVIFDKDYSVETAIKVPHDIISDYATYKPRVNGHILHLKGKVLEDERVIDITAQLKT